MKLVGCRLRLLLGLRGPRRRRGHHLRLLLTAATVLLLGVVLVCLATLSCLLHGLILAQIAEVEVGRNALPRLHRFAIVVLYVPMMKVRCL